MQATGGNSSYPQLRLPRIPGVIYRPRDQSTPVANRSSLDGATSTAQQRDPAASATVDDIRSELDSLDARLPSGAPRDQGAPHDIGTSRYSIDGSAKFISGPFTPPQRTSRAIYELEHVSVAHQKSSQQWQNFIKEIERVSSPAIRPTFKTLPRLASRDRDAKLPLGFVLQSPSKSSEVPTVDFSITHKCKEIPRCVNCRAYINPFVRWINRGRSWICNLCGSETDTAHGYFAPLDEYGERIDRHERPELSRGSIEIMAPSGVYSLRHNAAPVFVFVIDVSYLSVATGFLRAATMSIKQVIQSHRIVGGSRVQIGIVTFDSTVHFYDLSSVSSADKMMMSSSHIALSPPESLLVNATERETNIVNLLDRLPDIFRGSTIKDSCMGAAIKAACVALEGVGGKLLVLAAARPTIGDLALPRRTDPEAETEDPDWREMSCRRLVKQLKREHTSVELFVAPQEHVDLATLSSLSKCTGGDVWYYPRFTSHEHGEKLHNELVHVLTRHMGLDAVVRVRLSKGWELSGFYGTGRHLYEGNSLLSTPSCTADQTFAFGLEISDDVDVVQPVLFIQSALLYTSVEGERRIRVNTYACSTTRDSEGVLKSIDIQAMVKLMSCQFIENCVEQNVDDSMRKLLSQCQQLVEAARSADPKLLHYVMGMLKSPAARQTRDVGEDMRAFIWNRLDSLNINQLLSYYCPRMMALHTLNGTEGLVLNESGKVKLPPPLQLSRTSMSEAGAYLLEDGESIVMWIGKDVSKDFLQRVFGVSSVEHLSEAREQILERTANPLATKIKNIIQQVRQEQPLPFMVLHIIRSGDLDWKARSVCASLIDDKTDSWPVSFSEFLERMRFTGPRQIPSDFVALESQRYSVNHFNLILGVSVSLVCAFISLKSFRRVHRLAWGLQEPLTYIHSDVYP